MAQRVQAGIQAAELAGKHRAGQTSHVPLCQQGQLHGAHIAVSHQQGARFAHAVAKPAPVDQRQQSDGSIASTHTQQQRRQRGASLCDILQVGSPFGIGTGKALVTPIEGGRVVHHESRALQPLQADTDALRVGQIIGAGKEAQMGRCRFRGLGCTASQRPQACACCSRPELQPGPARDRQVLRKRERHGRHGAIVASFRARMGHRWRFAWQFLNDARRMSTAPRWDDPYQASGRARHGGGLPST